MPHRPHATCRDENPSHDSQLDGLRAYACIDRRKDISPRSDFHRLQNLDQVIGVCQYNQRHFSQLGSEFDYLVRLFDFCQLAVCEIVENSRKRRMPILNGPPFFK